MKTFLLATLFCSSVSLFCYNGSRTENGQTGGKGFEPSQKAATLVLTNKPTETKDTITISSPDIANPLGFGFLDRD